MQHTYGNSQKPTYGRSASSRSWLGAWEDGTATLRDSLAGSSYKTEHAVILGSSTEHLHALFTAALSTAAQLQREMVWGRQSRGLWGRERRPAEEVEPGVKQG